MAGVGFFYAVNRGDVRVIQRCQHSGFTLESPNTFGIVAKRFRKKFDGDTADQLRIGGLIYVAHTARSDMIGDLAMREFCSDYGVNEICGRIVSNYLHITQPFDTYDKNEMKMILSVRNTAYPSLSRATFRGNSHFPDTRPYVN